MSEARFAILTRRLPPSLNGQSIILGQLLAGFSPQQAVLLLNEYYPPGTFSSSYHWLNESAPFARPISLPGMNPQGTSTAHRVLRPALPAYGKLRNWLRGEPTSNDPEAIIQRRAERIAHWLQAENCQVLIACTGDLYNLPAAQRACQQVGIPLVTYVFDYYQYQWRAELRTYAAQTEAEVLQSSAAVIVPNEKLAEAYQTQYNITSHIIRNACTIPELSLYETRELHDPVRIVFTGSIYSAHYDAFRNLLAAIESIESPRVELHIYTPQPALRLRLDGIQGERLMVHPALPHAQVTAVQRAADMLFLPLAFDSDIPEVIHTSAPGKMGEYLAVERPILVHAPAESFPAWYFQQHQCGAVVDEPNVEHLRATILRIINDHEYHHAIAHNARHRAETEYDIAVAQAQLKQVLAGVMSS